MHINFRLNTFWNLRYSKYILVFLKTFFFVGQSIDYYLIHDSPKDVIWPEVTLTDSDFSSDLLLHV